MVNTDFYTNAKIYKIVCNITGLIYVGSTCKKLCQRIAQHRRDYKQYTEGKRSFITSFEIIKNGNYDIILIENCENITSIEQLRARERYYIESLNCVNKVIPTRTQKEYNDNHKEEIKLYLTQYQKENKDKIAIKKKEYAEKHKEERAVYMKEYVEKNKDKINERVKAKYVCECGIPYTYCHKLRHLKTLRHINYVNSKTNKESVEIL